MAADATAANVPPPGFRRWENKVSGRLHSDPFEDTAGPFWTHVSERRSGFYCDVHNCNAMGFAHGGLLATLADLNMFVHLEHGGVTLNLSLSYIGIGRKGEWIEARSEVVRETKNFVFVEGKIYGAEDRLIASFSGIIKKAARRRRKDTPVPAPNAQAAAESRL